MAETKVIRPDLQFVRTIKEAGGDTVKSCMQCANCSVACKLAPADSPFPRKEMIMAQWGQRDELLHDPDIWLCFGCTDCSIQCPRGARPGDIMAAVRKETIREYAPLGFIQNWLSSPNYLPVLVLVPVLLWGLIFLLFKDPTGNESYFDGIFPPGVLEPVLGAMTVLGSLLLAIGGLRYWFALVKRHPRREGGQGLVASAVGAITDIVTHSRFRKCEEGGTRAIGHMLMFFGFMIIVAGGTIVGMGFMFFHLKLPLAWTSPMKIALNIGAVMLVTGTFILLWYRLTRPDRQMKGTWYDWFFLWSLFITGVTGLLTEITRGIGIRELAFGVYFVHLVSVFCLLGYAPWSKLAHLVYRAVAMAHARYTGRELPVECATEKTEPKAA